MHRTLDRLAPAIRPIALVASLLAAVLARPMPAGPRDVEAPLRAVAPATATMSRAGDEVSIDDLDARWHDQGGRAVRLAELRAPVRVVALVYTHCEATCPLVVADLKRVEASVAAARRGDVRFVLVSLDPERDTPGRLAEWARATRLDPARWTLLAGSDEAVRELAATLDVRYQRQAGGEVAHANVITVVAPDGTIAHQQAGLGDPAGETIAAVGALLR